MVSAPVAMARGVMRMTAQMVHSAGTVDTSVVAGVNVRAMNYQPECRILLGVVVLQRHVPWQNSTVILCLLVTGFRFDQERWHPGTMGQ